MRKKRERPANEIPLDDGVRNGTEHWRDLGGVTFCHWDRWLLRLALDEPILGAACEAIANVDDSDGDLAQHFREAELAYLDRLGTYLERPGVLRDRLELATWEDYGLFHHIEVFLKWMPERGADLAVRELAQLIAELRAADLGYQVSKAQRLRQLVIASADTADAVIGREVGAR